MTHADMVGAGRKSSLSDKVHGDGLTSEGVGRLQSRARHVAESALSRSA